MYPLLESIEKQLTILPSGTMHKNDDGMGIFFWFCFMAHPKSCRPLPSAFESGAVLTASCWTERYRLLKGSSMVTSERCGRGRGWEEFKTNLGTIPLIFKNTWTPHHLKMI